MSVRSVVVRLEAEVSQYVAGMGRSAAATDNVARQIVNTRRNITENEQAMKDLGGSFLKVGAVGVAALGATAKAAMDWESAWAGVTKTVDGTPDQMNQLEASLRGLAKTLPSTHTEIAGVAEAAGQLGVARKDVVGFTKTMIDLGETTNLSADDAATAIAQITNVMGTMGNPEYTNPVERFGATLVALGNDGASTEKEIVNMAQRLSGAMKLVGGSESDLLAMANAMASVGIQAELGGGVMSRVMQRMYADVQEGGEGLDALAKVAGVSSKEFATAFESDPVRAVDTLIKGLSRVKDEGGNVIATMKDLGIKGTEETSVILRLAGAGDLLSDSLTLGAKAWAENTALAAEAEKRYATTEAKISIAWNKIKDAAIDAGGVLLPVISGMVEAVGGLATGFGELAPPVQTGLTIIAGVTTAAALLGGGLLVLIPKIAATRLAMQTLSTSGSRIPGVMTKIGKAAGGAVVGLLLIAGAIKLFDLAFGTAKLNVEEFGQALVVAGSDMTKMNRLFHQEGKGVRGEVTGIGQALHELGDQNWYDKMSEGFTNLVGLSDEVTTMRDGIEALDSSMAALAAAGNFEQVGEQFAAIKAESDKWSDANGKARMTTSELLDLMPEYESALLAAASAAGVNLSEEEKLNFALGKMPASMTAVTVGMDAIKASVDDTGVSVGAIIEDMDKFLEQLFALGLATMSSRDANAAYNEALRGIKPTLDEINAAGGEMGAMLLANKSDFDLSTEAGSKANSAFQDLAQKGMNEVEAKAREGLGQDELQKKLTQTHADLITAANDMGITGGAADALARKVLGVPDGIDIKTWIDDIASQKADALDTKLNNLDGKTVDTYINTHYTSIVKEERIANAPGGSGGLQRAAGGAIYGPGTSTSDDVPVMASNGEHMLTAAEVRMAGGHAGVYNLRAQIRQGNLPGASSSGLGSMAPARQLVSAWSAPAPNFNVTGTFINPFTGKEVVAVMQNIAVAEANNAVSSANDNAGRRPAR